MLWLVSKAAYEKQKDDALRRMLEQESKFKWSELLSEEPPASLTM